MTLAAGLRRSRAWPPGAGTVCPGRWSPCRAIGRRSRWRRRPSSTCCRASRTRRSARARACRSFDVGSAWRGAGPEIALVRGHLVDLRLEGRLPGVLPRRILVAHLAGAIEIVVCLPPHARARAVLAPVEASAKRNAARAFGLALRCARALRAGFPSKSGRASLARMEGTSDCQLVATHAAGRSIRGASERLAWSSVRLGLGRACWPRAALSAVPRCVLRAIVITRFAAS